MICALRTIRIASNVLKKTASGFGSTALGLLLLCPADAKGALEQDNSQLVEVQMQNVMYHFTDAIAVHIQSLHGYLQPTKGEIPVFDDKESFKLKISLAQIAISADSLASVLNSYVFSGHDAPLKGLSIRVEENGRLKVKGKLHNKGDIPFETDGALSVTPEGKIRLHAEKIKALHLPVKGLLDMLGVDLADLVKTGKVQGVEVEKDDLILDPEKILPPPHMLGQVTEVHAQNGEIVQTIGHQESGLQRVPATNYMAYRKNQLRFGKLTMSDTDLILIDMDPGDPFDFNLDHYREQLVAGYTKETPSFGLRVYMRDYNKLHHAKSNPGSGTASK